MAPMVHCFPATLRVPVSSLLSPQRRQGSLSSMDVLGPTQMVVQLLCGPVDVVASSSCSSSLFAPGNQRNVRKRKRERCHRQKKVLSSHLRLFVTNQRVFAFH
ncbi:hypothetical protein TcCL_NonESM01508 [Trypanosoma cruzi]|nr:hypothetical protein TcCL_NonESM01508 [Trypanosoma cruzi]